MDILDQMDIGSLENCVLISVNNPSADVVILEIISNNDNRRDHFNLKITNIIKIYYQRFESSVQREGFRNLKRVKLDKDHHEWINHFDNWQSPFTNEVGFEMLLYSGTILRFVGNNISFEKEILEEIQTSEDLDKIPDKVQKTSAKIVANTSFIKKQVKEESIDIETLEEETKESISDEEMISDQSLHQTNIEETPFEIDETETNSNMDIVETSSIGGVSTNDDSRTETPTEEFEIPEVDEEISNEMSDMEGSFNEERHISKDKQIEVSNNEPKLSKIVKESIDEMPIIKESLNEELPISEDVQIETPKDEPELPQLEEEIPREQIEISSEENIITHKHNNDVDFEKFIEAIVSEDMDQLESVENIPKGKPKDLLAQITEGEVIPDTTDSLEAKNNQSSILKVDGIDKGNLNNILSLGLDTIEKLAHAKISELVKINGIGKATARKIIDSANKLISK